MSRDRFLQIYRGIHPDGDELFQHFCEVNKKYWQSGKEVSIDETLYPFKGRTKYRQRVTNKPYSTGLKFYTLADSYGFILDIFLYKSKDTSEVEIFQIDREDRDSSTVVELIDHFLKRLPKGTSYSFFMDKFYGSLEVMKLLKEYLSVQSKEA